jgi:hypothetical protein
LARHLIPTAYHTTGADGRTAAWQQKKNPKKHTLHRATAKNQTLMGMHKTRYCLPPTCAQTARTYQTHIQSTLTRLDHCSGQLTQVFPPPNAADMHC